MASETCDVIDDVIIDAP